MPGYGPGFGANKRLTNLAAGVLAGILAATPFAVTGQTTEFTLSQRYTRQIWMEDYGALFNGTDQTTAFRAAINVAAAKPGGGSVYMPDGIIKLSSTVVIPYNVSLYGQGRSRTYIYKTTEYGNMLEFGSVANHWQGGQTADYTIYHDYGFGQFPPATATVAVPNPSGAGNIMYFFGPYNGRVENVWAIGGQAQMVIEGGSTTVFVNCATIGVYHPGNAFLQFSLRGVFMIKGRNPGNELPTNIDFIGCCLNGVITPPISIGPPAVYESITWPSAGAGPFTSTDVNRNIGPLRLFEVQCCEAVRFLGGYMGAASKYNLGFHSNTTDLLSGFEMRGTFMDAAHEAMAGFTGTGTPSSISLHAQEWVAQFNGFSLLTDEQATPVSTISVDGLETSGIGRAFVGPAFRVIAARGFEFNHSTIRSYNAKGFYTAITGYNCGGHLGAGCSKGTVIGRYGGDGAWAQDAKTAVGWNVVPTGIDIDTTGVKDGGVAAIKNLVVGGFSSANLDATDADQTVFPYGPMFVIDSIGTITANRTWTLSKVRCRNGDKVRVTRSGPGAFTINVAGVTGKALAQNTWVEYTYFVSADQWRQSAYGAL